MIFTDVRGVHTPKELVIVYILSHIQKICSEMLNWKGMRWGDGGGGIGGGLGGVGGGENYPVISLSYVCMLGKFPSLK